MPGKCLLFVYGQLKPGHQPPRSLSQAFADEIKGLMYDLGDFPAAVELGKGSGLIRGFTIEIERDELPMIDEFEDVETGMYRRIMVETEAGYFAWAYEYLLEIPQGLSPITDWIKS